MKNYGFLNNNALKWIALITMTIDHAGLLLFPGLRIMRTVGRLSFPIYAYLIAEGCRYTRDKKKYFLNIFGLGVLCQIVYFIAGRSLDMCILITFSFSILVIYALQFARASKNIFSYGLPAVATAGAIAICYGIPKFFPEFGFSVDYGILGVAVPVFISLSDNKYIKLALGAFALSLLAWKSNDNQWFSLLALIPLFFYNGERGKMNIKTFFYLYYPLHLAVLWLIYIFI